jgi:hypothetical protein
MAMENYPKGNVEETTSSLHAFAGDNYIRVSEIGDAFARTP